MEFGAVTDDDDFPGLVEQAPFHFQFGFVDGGKAVGSENAVASQIDGIKLDVFDGIARKHAVSSFAGIVDHASDHDGFEVHGCQHGGQRQGVGGHGEIFFGAQGFQSLDDCGACIQKDHFSVADPGQGGYGGGQLAAHMFGGTDGQGLFFQCLYQADVAVFFDHHAGVCQTAQITSERFGGDVQAGSQFGDAHALFLFENFENLTDPAVFFIWHPG